MKNETTNTNTFGGVRCGLGHSGNQKLTVAGRWAECNGCGRPYSLAQVVAAQGKRGANGGGRLYDASASGF